LSDVEVAGVVVLFEGSSEDPGDHRLLPAEGRLSWGLGAFQSLTPAAARTRMG
jgi:hypothetical protein